MNGELQRLLGLAVGGEGGVDESAWERVIVVRSGGGGGIVGVRGGVDAGETVDHGVQFILLDKSGHPTHYCKCRSVRRDGEMHREAQVLLGLTAHPATRSLVPESRVVRGDRLELQTTEFVAGDRLDVRLRRGGAAERHQLLADVLKSVRPLREMAHLALGAPGFREGRAMLTKLEGDLENMGVPTSAVTQVLTLVERVEPVSAQAQHGDLWPPNVVLAEDGSTRILDLDQFGAVTTPLYDACHLLRTSWGLLPENSGCSWIEALLSHSGAASLAWRNLLVREAKEGRVASADLMGLVALYTVEVAVRTYRRGGPPSYWSHFKREVEVLADSFQAAGSLEGLSEPLRSAEEQA